MSFITVVAIIFAGLFLLAFGFKRRIGVLGLALAAGGILNHLWVGELTPIVAEAGVQLVAPPLESVVSAGLILLPAIVLLLSGPTYRSMQARLLGSLVFAALGLTLLLEPLGSGLVMEGWGWLLYDFVQQHQAVIVTIGLIIAIFDMLVSKAPKARKTGAKR